MGKTEAQHFGVELHTELGINEHLCEKCLHGKVCAIRDETLTVRLLLKKVLQRRIADTWWYVSVVKCPHFLEEDDGTG